MGHINHFFSAIIKLGVVIKIIIALALGVALALIAPDAAKGVSFMGSLFVSALKAVAPVLVFVLVMSSIANQKPNSNTHMRPILLLYLIGTLSAAITAVSLSFLFPATLTLVPSSTEISPPEGITEVLHTLLFNITQNPITALAQGNYIGILAWAIALGLLFRQANSSSKTLLSDLAAAVTSVVQWVIQLAPIGIFGLIAGTIATTGFGEFKNYTHIVMLLIGSMLIIALIINPIIVFVKTRKNPYPLVLRCLRDSGITAFFTRSSAANIPVNLDLCRTLKLDKDTYSVSIPLGANINMAGAAITITIMTLAAANTQGINVDIITALLLCLVAAISACGSSGVAGGSLLLIPLACSLFGIPNEIAIQVVGVGFIIGVIQDSAETAVNSSTDVIFTAAVLAKQQ